MFTVTQIRSLDPRTTPYRLRDKGGQEGLVLQITPSGTKTFFFNYKWEDQSRYLKLGRFPTVTLAKARIYAQTGCELVASEKDPVQYSSTPSSLASLLELYIKYLESAGSINHSKVVQKTVEREIRPNISLELAAIEFNASAATDFLKRLSEQKSPASAQKVKEYLQAAFNHAMKHDSEAGHPLGDHLFFGIKNNPMSGILKDADRSSTDSKKEKVAYSKNELIEILSVLSSSELIEQRLASVIRFLLATGQKLSTVLRVQRTDIDLDLGIWIVSHSKSETASDTLARRIPLNHYAVTIIREILRDNKKNPYLFGRPFNDAPPRLDSVGKILKVFSKRSGIPILTAQKLYQSSLVLIAKARTDLSNSTQPAKSEKLNENYKPAIQEIYASLSNTLWMYDEEKKSSNSFWKKLDRFEQEHRKGTPLARFEALLLAWKNECLIPDWIGQSLEQSINLTKDGEKLEEAFDFQSPSKTRRMENKIQTVAAALERMKEQGYPVNRKTFEIILDLPEVQSAGIKSASTAERLYYASNVQK